MSVDQVTPKTAHQVAVEMQLRQDIIAAAEKARDALGISDLDALQFVANAMMTVLVGIGSVGYSGNAARIRHWAVRLLDFVVSRQLPPAVDLSRVRPAGEA